MEISLAIYEVIKKFRSPSQKLDDTNKIAYRVFNPGEKVIAYDSFMPNVAPAVVTVKGSFVIPVALVRKVRDLSEREACDYLDLPPITGRERIGRDGRIMMSPIEKVKKIASGDLITTSIEDTRSSSRLMLIGAGIGAVMGLFQNQNVLVWGGAGAFGGYLVSKVRGSLKSTVDKTKVETK